MQLEFEPFVVWIDNFTKIHRRDFRITETVAKDLKSYSIHDLTVSCIFLSSKRDSLSNELYKKVYNEPHSYEFHCLDIFDFTRQLSSSLPTFVQSGLNYVPYKGFLVLPLKRSRTGFIFKPFFFSQ